MCNMINKLSRLLLLLLVTSSISAEQSTSISDDILKEWTSAVSGKTRAPNPASPLVGSKEWNVILGKLPPKCQGHLQDEVEELKKSAYDEHQWMKHVASCPCCGPALAGVLGAHVENVAKLPHIVVFFDFNSSELTFDNKNRLSSFINDNYSKKRRFLIIARSSRTLKSNISLEYLRDHSSYNFRLSEKRAISVRDFLKKVLFEGKNPSPNKLFDILPIRMFGLADPQIKPRYADLYNFKPEQWKKRYFKGKDLDGAYRLNQSVVVIAFDGELRDDLDIHEKHAKQ